jgi:16S rRNA (uracil1498-N3)-methyltransferase
LSEGSTVELDATAARHIVRVLRLGPGQALSLFDGNGLEADGRLQQVARRSVAVRLGAVRRASLESPLQVTLAQAVCRSDRMDFALQKAVELGVSTIIPLMAARSRLPDDPRHLARKQAHWQGVIVAACEQSGRAHVPRCAPVQALDDWLQGEPLAADMGLVLDPAATCGMHDYPRPRGKVKVLIGPEGGLSHSELEQALACGFRSLRLGPRILRTETAGMATLAALQVLWGDLG